MRSESDQIQRWHLIGTVFLFISPSRLINGQQGITIKSYSSRSLLNVNNVTEEHFGNYTCVAANKLGTTNASLLLNRKSRERVKNIYVWAIVISFILKNKKRQKCS